MFKSNLLLPKPGAALLVFLLAVLVLGFGGPNLLAAPCCGGASGLPALITGDDRAQLTLSVSQGTIIGDAPVAGIPVFRSGTSSELSQTVRMEGAYLIADSFQVGGSLPLIRRSRDGGLGDSSATGLGDVGIDAAYEIMPELNYSSWKPKAFLFLQMISPTGSSIYDASGKYLLDARGRGFFTVALGSALTKISGNWDFLGSAEVHRSFSRSFTTLEASTVLIEPGFGGSLLLGAGYSPSGGAIRFGLSLSPVYEGALRFSQAVNSKSDAQLVWNASLQAGLALSQDFSANLSYTDQTLIGPASNVSLSRTMAMSVQKRWVL